MRSANPNRNRRQQNRVPAVLPVRVRGKDAEGQPFEEIAHTLDITAMGSRLAAIRRRLKIGDRLTVAYRQLRMAFSVVWAKEMNEREFQVGLQTVNQEYESWGLKPSEIHTPSSSSIANVAVRCEAQESRG